MDITQLRGMTWDHPRGLDSLVHSDSLLQQECGISVQWDARSLLDFGDQHVSEFYKHYDLMIIDHPHVPDAVAQETVIAFEDLISAKELQELKATSVGESHESYKYRGKHWALAIDAAAQVSAFRPDKVSQSPTTWIEVLEIAKAGKLLWAYKPVDAFSTFSTMMAQKGTPLMHNGHFIEPDNAAETLQFLIELAQRVPEICATSNPIDAAELLSTTDDYEYAVCMYGYSNYSRDGFRKNY
jgi:multiple sugar transport system substrate-binding protein